jgi:hypothetical protein
VKTLAAKPSWIGLGFPTIVAFNNTPSRTFNWLDGSSAVFSSWKDEWNYNRWPTLKRHTSFRPATVASSDIAS